MTKKLLVLILLSTLLITLQNNVHAQSTNAQDYIVDIFMTDDGGNCGEFPSPAYQFTHTLVNVVMDLDRLIQDINPSVLTLRIIDANNVFIGEAGYVVPENNPPSTTTLRGRIYGLTPFVGSGASSPTSRPWTLKMSYVNNERTSIFFFDPIVIDPANYLTSCERLPYLDSPNSGPLNTGYSENEVGIYNATDENGDPALHIYDIDTEGNGTLALEITQDTITPYIDNPPAENTELMSSDNVTLYILDTGELQINSGPDEEGKIHVLIFDGIPPNRFYGYIIDPPMFPFNG